ncbi:hypothetical protein ACVCDT_02135 [Paraglaciecola aestuariivivens]
MSHAGEFVVGVEDLHYLPYFDFTNPSSRSFTKELLDQFALDSGHKLTYLPLPIKQFPRWLAEENIDFKFPDNEMWPKKFNVVELPISYSDEVVPMVAGTLVLNKHQNVPHTFIKSVGTITGFHTTFWREKIDQGEVTLFEDPSPRILVQYLVNGLIDGLVIDIAVANKELENLNVTERLVYSDKLSQNSYSYKLSTIKYPQVIAEFNQWQKQNQRFVNELRREFGIATQSSNQASIIQR